MLMLAGWFSRIFGIGFRVDGFIAAFLGALVVSVVSTVLSWVFMPSRKAA
jgi:putative membrane protein